MTTTTKTVKLPLQAADFVELYYSVNEDMQEKLGPDGKEVSAETKWTPEEAFTLYCAANSKAEGLSEGWYDDEPGEVNKPGSETAVWHDQMCVIAGAIQNVLFTVDEFPPKSLLSVK